MENLIRLNSVLKSEDVLRGRIFTSLQLEILKKKLKLKKLNSNEQTYYYKFIKPKLKAMLSLFDIEENIVGKENMIEERVPKAIKLVNEMKAKYKNKRVIVSGSYLFSEKYNDIDVFVFAKYLKEDYKKGKKHINFIPESALSSLFFSSLSKISVSNFAISPRREFSIEIGDLMQDYEMIVKFIMDGEDCKTEMRRLILSCEYMSKGTILNPRELYFLMQKFGNGKKIIPKLPYYFINSLLLGYGKDTLNVKMREQIENYSKMLKDYSKMDNINIYLSTYKKVLELAA